MSRFIAQLLIQLMFCLIISYLFNQISFFFIANYDNQCSGGSGTNHGCCSITNKCDLGGGDCDNDSDCKENLICGINNCKRDFSSNYTTWNWYDQPPSAQIA